MGAATDPLGTAFGDAALDSSRVFRALMNATAWPGRVQAFTPISAPPAPLTAMASDALLTLVDFDTPLWVDPAGKTPEVCAYIRFHCGCAIVDEPAEAAFAIIFDPDAMPNLAAFAQGTPDYPDRSATVILQCGAFSDKETVVFRGPGIPDQQAFWAGGIPERLWRDIEHNHRGFPLGVDVIFTNPQGIAACPRSVNIAVSEPV